MPTILDISEPVGSFDFALRIRGVVVPILSPYRDGMDSGVECSTGIRGIAVRVWLRVMGQTPEGMLRTKIKRSIPEQYRPLVDELSGVELIHAYTYLDQVMSHWTNSLMLKAAEALASKQKGPSAPQVVEATRGHGAAPGAGAGYPVMTPIVPGGTLHGHPVGRARTAEHGTLQF